MIGSVGSDPSQRDRRLTGGDKEPWLTREFIDQFESWDTSTWNGLEWGSGDSTLWLSRRTRSLITVEHDPKYAQKARERLPSNVTLVESPLRETYWNPEAGQLDYALVDGRVRVRCVVHVVEKMRDGGLVILDNADRPFYAIGRELLSDVCREQWTTTNGHWRTDAWRIDAAKVAGLARRIQALKQAPCGAFRVAP